MDTFRWTGRCPADLLDMPLRQGCELNYFDDRYTRFSKRLAPCRMCGGPVQVSEVGSIPRVQRPFSPHSRIEQCAYCGLRDQYRPA
jgi:hypothetical protein